MNNEIYTQVKTLYDKHYTANYIFKHVEGLENELNSIFKNTLLDIKTVFGNEGNAAEKIYAYLFGIHYCPICNKKTSYISRTKGYNMYCKDCGQHIGGKNGACTIIKRSNKHIETFICKECGKKFKHIVYPNNKAKSIYYFCSPSCHFTYEHKHMSDECKFKMEEKKKKTCLEKYGSEYVVNSQYTRNKTKEKLGVEYPQYLPNYGEICKESYKNSHNGQSFHHTEETKKQILKTKLEKYGEMLSPIKNKIYVFPSGREVYVQGYENLAIDELLKTYDETDIIVERKNIKNEIGKDIVYKDYNGVSHLYFPDIYIKSKNLIIEVKSKYTYNIHKEINELKRNAVLNNNIDFKFMIIETFHKKIKSYKFI